MFDNNRSFTSIGAVITALCHLLMKPPCDTVASILVFPTAVTAPHDALILTNVWLHNLRLAAAQLQVPNSCLTKKQLVVVSLTTSWMGVHGLSS